MASIIELSARSAEISRDAVAGELERLIHKALAPDATAISPTSAERLLELNQQHHLFSPALAWRLNCPVQACAVPIIPALRQINDYPPLSNVWLHQPEAGRNKLRLVEGIVCQPNPYDGLGYVTINLRGVLAAVKPGYVGLMTRGDYDLYQHVHNIERKPSYNPLSVNLMASRLLTMLGVGDFTSHEVFVKFIRTTQKKDYHPRPDGWHEDPFS